MEYAREKLYDIIKYLATAEGDMRERLEAMAVEIDLLRQDNFPEDLKHIWVSIEKKLYKYPEQYNWNGTRQDMSSVEHSLSHMYNRNACKIAKDIFQLWEELNIRIGGI